MSVTLQCTEAEDETPVQSEENFLHLSCFIGQDTGHMNSGLKAVRQRYRVCNCSSYLSGGHESGHLHSSFIVTP